MSWFLFTMIFPWIMVPFYGYNTSGLILCYGIEALFSFALFAASILTDYYDPKWKSAGISSVSLWNTFSLYSI